MERARQRYGSSDYRAAVGVMRPVLVRMIAEDYAESVAAVRCPVELVWGDDDDVVPLAMARTLVSTIPEARLTVCPGAGHFVPTAAPADLRAAVERLVSAQGASAR
jgi:pimeloyl-ACP methyl ester carboxylesterase